MKPAFALAAMLGGAALGGIAWAQSVPLSGTAGPYAVVMEYDAAHPEYTIYRPADPAKVKRRMPFVAFGNGGCINVGSLEKTFLGKLASYGYIVTTPGKIQRDGEGLPMRPRHAAGAAPGAAPPPLPPGGLAAFQSKPDQLIRAIDWAFDLDRAGPLRGRVDTKHIAVMGGSCGGLEAIAAAGDPRVATVVDNNSGIIRGGIPNADGTTRAPAGRMPAQESDLAKFHTPAIYINGGSHDQSHPGAEADFVQIQNVPLINANIETGHSGTWSQPHGGAMGAVALAWLDWRLKGDHSAAKMFVCSDCTLCRSRVWTVKKKNMK